MTYNILPENHTYSYLTWKSSDEGIATVDENGKVKHDTLMQYKIPSRKDLGNINVIFSYSNEPTGPFGAKSIGEVVINTASPAIADAIYNATKARVRSLPITSEKLFWAIQAK